MLPMYFTHSWKFDPKSIYLKIYIAFGLCYSDTNSIYSASSICYALIVRVNVAKRAHLQWDLSTKLWRSSNLLLGEK